MPHLNKICAVLLLLSSLTTVNAQDDQILLWRQMMLKGAFGVFGHKRTRTTHWNTNFSETINTSNLKGKMAVRSRGAFLHPNFMVIDLDAELQPGGQSDEYLVAPDRSETRLYDHGRVFVSIFQKLPVSANMYYDFSRSLINRELLTSVKNRTRTWGATTSFRNRILPIQFSYNASKSDEIEIYSLREFENRRSTARASMDKSFTFFDQTRLTFTRMEYTHNYRNTFKIHNKINTLDARNRLYFNRKKRSYLNSFLINTRQVGSSSFDQLQLNERLRVSLPLNFHFLAGLHYSAYEQRDYFINQRRTDVKLEHQLFASLNSSIYVAQAKTNQTGYTEDIAEKGFTVNYRKRIPSGLLSVRYDQTAMTRSQQSLLGDMPIVNEELRLVDEEIVLLRQPYAYKETVQITDETQSILYQNYFDYILIEAGQYLEVQRLPGGRIANGQTVLVDYRAAQQPSYDYNSINKNLSVNVSLFKQLITVYSRYSVQDYSNLRSDAPLLLNYFVRRTYGVHSFYKGFEFGAEVDDYRATILPYTLNRRFIGWSSTLYRRVNLLVRANRREYLYLEEMKKQLLSDIVGKLIFHWNSFTFSTYGNYRLQEGRGLDLNLMTFRGEISFRYYGLFFTVGYENYDRTLFNERIQYGGGYFSIERKF